MGEEDFMKIHAALFATATDDEGDEGDVAEDDDAAEIYTHDDEDYYDEDEYEDDHQYDDWIENTYWAGDDTQVLQEMIDKLNAAVNKLEQAADYMEHDEHRYYPEDYHYLDTLIGELETVVIPVVTKANRINEAAGDYSTW